MSGFDTEVTDFQQTRVWLGEGNSEPACTFTVIRHDCRRVEGVRAYFSDGKFVVDSGAHDTEELAQALKADPHFSEVVQDYLMFGLEPATYLTQLAA